MKLGPLEEDLYGGYHTLDDYGYEIDRDRLAPILQLVLNLQGKSRDVTTLTGDVLDQDAFWAQHSLVSPVSGRANEEILQMFFRARLYLAYLFGNHGAALSMIQKLNNIKILTTPCVWLVYQTFYHGMTLFALARKTKNLMTRAMHVRNGRKCLKTFGHWVSHGAMNCAHMLLLLRAERLAVAPTSSVETVQKAYEKLLQLQDALVSFKTGLLGIKELACSFWRSMTNTGPRIT